jgi:predicted transcriptional regulator
MIKNPKTEVIGMSTKEVVIKIINEMPDNATIEDIMYQLYIRSKIEAGLKELDEGRGIPHEEAMEKISKWLN